MEVLRDGGHDVGVDQQRALANGKRRKSVVSYGGCDRRIQKCVGLRGVGCGGGMGWET